MGDELDGRPGDAERRYSVAYLMARCHDGLTRLYEQARP